MLHGDISNQVSGTIAIRGVRTLFDYRTQGIKNKILNAVYGKDRRVVFNDSMNRALEYIYRNTDMCIDIVLFEHEYNKELEEFLLEHCAFNRLLLVKRPAQINTRLLSGDILYYIDDDTETRNLVNHRYAMKSNQLWDIIRIRKRGE